MSRRRHKGQAIRYDYPVVTANSDDLGVKAIAEGEDDPDLVPGAELLKWEQ